MGWVYWNCKLANFARAIKESRAAAGDHTAAIQCYIVPPWRWTRLQHDPGSICRRHTSGHTARQLYAQPAHGRRCQLPRADRLLIRQRKGVSRLGRKTPVDI